MINTPALWWISELKELSSLGRELYISAPPETPTLTYTLPKEQYGAAGLLQQFPSLISIYFY